MSYATSLSGLQNAQTDLNVIGNNIANADTTGFKSSNVQFANLVAASAYSNPRDIVGIGSSVAQIEQNFSQGSVSQTGSALDLAISGEGFAGHVASIVHPQRQFFARFENGGDHRQQLCRGCQ